MGTRVGRIGYAEAAPAAARVRRDMCVRYTRFPPAFAFACACGAVKQDGWAVQKIRLSL